MNKFINGENFIVLIPAHNEEKTIYSVVTGARKQLNNVVVVDDGSADSTSIEAEKAGAKVLRHDKNIGKGAALKTGFNYILKSFPDFEAVITLDGDGQHNPNEIPKFIEAFKGAGVDLILGERTINRSQMPFLRRIGNRFFSWLISKKIGQKIVDSQTGFRLLSRRLLEGLNLKSLSYGVETETLLVVDRNKFKTKTLPISTIYSNNRKQINFLKDIKIIISILGEIFS